MGSGGGGCGGERRVKGRGSSLSGRELGFVFEATSFFVGCDFLLDGLLGGDVVFLFLSLFCGDLDLLLLSEFFFDVLDFFGGLEANFLDGVSWGVCNCILED